MEGGITETEAIVGAARKNLPAGGEGEEATRVSTDMILEQQEEEQEAGPELDPDGLKKAREKAMEGKKAERSEAVDAKGANTTGES